MTYAEYVATFPCVRCGCPKVSAVFFTPYNRGRRLCVPLCPHCGADLSRTGHLPGWDWPTVRDRFTRRAVDLQRQWLAQCNKEPEANALIAATLGKLIGELEK